jgi:predicted nucleic acid-binding protein
MEIDNVIPQKALEEFKELYKKRFRKDLSDEEVYRKASKILDLFEVIYGQKYKNNHKIIINKY